MIYAVCGPIGNGKSMYQLRRVIETAQRDRKYIVSNVPLDLNALHEYCVMRGFRWLAAQVRRGKVLIDTDFSRVSEYGRCVILADELGIFMNNREGLQGDDKKLRMRFIRALILSRKAFADLYWVAQDEELVDTQIRRLTQFYIHLYNSEPKAQKSTWSRYYIATIYEGSVKYQRWFKSQRFAAWLRYKMGSVFWMPGNPLWCKVFKNYDDLLFKVYKTHHRLDKSVVHYVDDVCAELGVGDELMVPGKYEAVMVPEEYRPGQNEPDEEGKRPHVIEGRELLSAVLAQAPVTTDAGYQRGRVTYHRTLKARYGLPEVWKAVKDA
ncbi:Zonular occludens toxin (Zot) [compost metagenome]